MNAFPVVGVSVVSCLFATSVWGGPNAGGVIIVHTNESLVYSDGNSYCGQSELGDCNDADVRIDDTATHILNVLAAFPAENSPRLAGVVFGIEYDEVHAEILDWDDCGDFALYGAAPDGDPWPSTGSYAAVTWNVGQTDHLVEILWVAIYGDSEPGSFDLVPGHVSGGAFADDDVPANIDPIADYGRLGFFQDGYLPCPSPPTPVQPSSWGSIKASYR
jgi:hypothetical protein